MSEIEVPTLKAKARVMIAVPSGDHVTTGFAHDLAQMIGQTVFNNPEIELRLEFNKGTLLPSQRTGLVYSALQHECTHILWLDSDMRFPPWTLRDLLSHKEPVLGANYVTRRFPLRPTAFSDRGLSERIYTEPDSTGIVEAVGGVGMGVLLMDLDVFRYVPQPWFMVDWVDDGNNAGHYRGEDLYLCDKLRTAGIPVLVSHDLSQHIRHEGSWDYSHANALAQRDAVQMVEAASRGTDHGLHDTPS